MGYKLSTNSKTTNNGIDGIMGQRTINALLSALEDPAMTPADTRLVQEALNAKGIDVGTADGIMGKNTVAGLFKALDIKQPEPAPAPPKGDWRSDWDKNLVGVHPDLVKVVRRAAELSPTPFRVLEGVRSDAQAYANWGKGRTVAQLKAKGVPTKYAQPNVPKVTWLNNPLATNHRKKSDGYGHAVDLFPAPYQWDDVKPFNELASVMFKAARELGVRVRWGADWNENGTPREKGEFDSPHFEI